MATPATYYGPFDAGSGANAQEEQWRTFMGGTTTSGVVAGYLNGLAVTGDSTGMQVKLATGGCWLNGGYGENTSGVQTISLAASHATLHRYDLIVARNNYTTNVVEFDVIQGSNSASPTVPSATVDTTKYEIALAYVYIAATVTTITAANVTDQRSYNNANNAFIKQTTLTTTASTITVDNLPARKFLKVIYATLGSGAISTSFRLNGDSGANYSYRYSLNGAADTTAVSQTAGGGPPLNTDAFAKYGYMDILNIASTEKICVAHTVEQAGTGAATAPARSTIVNKWANTSNQISSIGFTTPTNNYAAGSAITVIGSDVPF